MDQSIARRLQRALEGRYRVERELGTGGMAMVYLADDLRHGRKVAIKVVRPELGELLGRDRFLREIRVTASLSHPNIPPLLDSGDADGLLYYVMPFMVADTLGERLRREQRLGLEETLRIGRDVADALAYAHRVGLVHRDVKPSNIFLEEGHALLGDFGIALPDEGETARMTSGEVVLGTAEYMSPEQCTGSHAVDGRSDIYSVGCLLYEMLAGEPPFVGRSRVAVLARQVSEPAPSVTVFRPDVPPDVEAALRRCLAKAPSERFATAEQLRDTLDGILADVRQGTAGTRSARPHRVPGRALAGTLLVVVLLAAALLMLRPGTAPALSPVRVVIFPFADRGGSDSAGPDMAMIIGNALIQTEPLLWIDGWEWLSPEERADPSLITAEDRLQIARARGARWYITGGVASSNDSASVRMVLHDAGDDSLVRQVAAVDDMARVTLAQLGLRAVVQILPELVDPGRTVDVSFMEERSPQAVSNWVAGDLAYRQARFEEALNLYRLALEQDSLVVLAAVKGAMAASWNEEPELISELLEVAVRHDSLMPARYRDLTRGLVAFYDGRPAPALEAYQDALEGDSQWAEAWTAKGEVYRHLLPPDLGGPDSAEAAFLRALDADPDFSTPLVHLSEFALQRSELTTAQGFLSRLESARGEPLDSLPQLALMRDCADLAARGEPSYPPRITDPMPLLNAAWLFAAGGWNPGCAEVGFRRVLDQPALDEGVRWAAILGLQGILTAQGRWEELQAFLGESVRTVGAVNFLFALDAVAGAPLEQEATRAESIAVASRGYDGLGPTTAWLLTVWHAHRGDLEMVQTLESRLGDLARERDDDRTRRLLRAAQGHHALTRGDTARAVEVFSTLETPGRRRTMGTGMAEPFAPERLRLAELLLATGHPVDAYHTAALFDHTEPLTFIPYVARSLSVRLRAARDLGGTEWDRRAEEAEERLRALGRSDLLERAQGDRP